MLTKSISLFRWAVAAAFLVSIIWQITDRVAHGLFRPTEYFAYFSIITAEACVVTLAVSGWFAWSGRAETKLLSIVRLTSAACIAVVSMAYNVLLRGTANDVRDGNYAWPVMPNEIIHVWGPIFVVIDWLLIQYGPKLRLRAAFWVAVYPLAWLAFSVVRGLATNWWPYWFINPNDEGGLTGMITYLLAITVLLITVGFLLLAASRLTSRLVKLA
ncbi:MAG: Pr6Pr family membrane protein [Micrococcales bacterium]